MRDSAIQRFEFTFELFWKTLKAVGDEAGLTSYSPRDALRASQTYSEKRADAIYSRLAIHARMMRAALGRVRERASTADT